MPTCIVFAARMAEGVKGGEDCPGLSQENRAKLENYMEQFNFDV